MLIQSIINNILDNVQNHIHIKQLKDTISKNYTTINIYSNKINDLHNNIKHIEKKIFKCCKHKWVKDYNDLWSKYKVCSKCGLANMPHVYS